MAARTLLNLALLALVALLVVFALYEPGLERPAPGAALTTLAPEAIEAIRIERADKPTLSLARRDGQWWLDEPLHLPANAARAESITQLAQRSAHASYPVAELDLAALALDRPRVRLWLDDLQIDFGDISPLDQRRYLRIGETVYLIDEALFAVLNGDFSRFVSLALLPPQAAPLQIALPGMTLSQHNGRWSLDPARPEVSADSVQALVDAWRHAQALSVRRYEGAGSAEQITVRLADTEEPLRFQVLDTDPEFVLARRDLGVQYHMSAGAFASLTTLRPAGADGLPEPPPADLD